MDRNDAFINLFLPPELFEPAGPSLQGCRGRTGHRTLIKPPWIKPRAHLEEIWGGGDGKVDNGFQARETETVSGQWFLLGIFI